MRSLTLVAASAAVIALAGCGSHAAAQAGGASPSAASAPSCRQQYETWKHGTASSKLAALKSALRSVEAQGNAEDLPGLSTSLERAGRAASRMETVPPPKCSDPKGLYATVMARVKASGDNARSASGLTGLLLAEAPLKGLPAANPSSAKDSSRQACTGPSAEPTPSSPSAARKPAAPGKPSATSPALRHAPPDQAPLEDDLDYLQN
jgi:hypothetical protein